MNTKKYIEDFKNLKPLPPDRIPMNRHQSTASSRELKGVKAPQNNQQSSIIIHQSKTEVSKMETLNNSKTLWGFGIALFIYIVQQVLAVLNVAGPDNLLVKTVVEVVISIAGFFGVYGIRDALRKIRSDL